jgi:sialate O-acetylesterase
MSEAFHWPDGRRCAVSLTYDDALPVHYEHVGPRLEAHGLRGTFYLNIAGDPLRNFERWRELAARGHELGNHTLFHPCRRYGERRSWLDKGFDLRRYTAERLRRELYVANAYLHLLDGRSERTFAHTCCDKHIGPIWNRERIAHLVRGDFVAAREDIADRPVAISAGLDLMRIKCFIVDSHPLNTLRQLIERTQSRADWLCLAFHGVGPGTHPSQCTDPGVHEALIAWLAGQEDIWVKPFIDVAKWVRDWQRRVRPSPMAGR